MKFYSEYSENTDIETSFACSMQFCAGLLERRRCKFEVAEQCFIESQNTWLTGEQTRAHPHNAAVLYKLGACCLDQGKLEASMYDNPLDNIMTET